MRAAGLWSRSPHRSIARRPAAVYRSPTTSFTGTAASNSATSCGLSLISAAAAFSSVPGSSQKHRPPAADTAVSGNRWFRNRSASKSRRSGTRAPADCTARSRKIAADHSGSACAPSDTTATKISRTRFDSSVGRLPKNRLNSLLNCDALS